jgi:hypothetical protein
MTDIPDDIVDIDETDPLRIIVAIDRKLRPELSEVQTASDVPIVLKYCSTIRHACVLFGVEFNVAWPTDENNYGEIKQLFAATKLSIDHKKIDILYEKIQRETGVSLDASWRQKLHSYLLLIGQIVERVEVHPSIKENILDRLNALAKEIDRGRAPIQKFTDTLVAICHGMSTGADKLRPAVRLLERAIGALERLRGEKPKVLALPKPNDLGLPDAENETR